MKVGVRVCEGVNVALGVTVRLAVEVIVGVGGTVADAVIVGVDPGSRVRVGSAVALAVGRPNSTPSRCAL